MNEKSMLEYIENFMVGSNWDDDKVPEQCQALFTAWCFLFNVDVCTGKCIDALSRLHLKAALNELIDYEDFAIFMCDLIL